MVFLQNLKSFRLSIKRVIFGGLSGVVGVLGLLLAGALFVYLQSLLHFHPSIKTIMSAAITYPAPKQRPLC